MEDIITYIVVFGLGFTLLGIYLFQKDKKRVLPLSKQLYSDAIFNINVIKEQRKVIGIQINLTFVKKAQTVKDLIVELVNTKKEITTVSMSQLIKREETEETENPFEYSGTISFQSFKEILEQQNFIFESFRFVAETLDGKKYKSHQLGLHNWWTILKLDSGNYN